MRWVLWEEGWLVICGGSLGIGVLIVLRGFRVVDVARLGAVSRFFRVALDLVKIPM